MPSTIDERDSYGRITKRTLDSDTARKMAKKRWEKTTDEKKDRAELLITQAGYPDTEDAPEVLKAACEEIAHGGARVYAGVNAYLRLMAPSQKEPETQEKDRDCFCHIFPEWFTDKMIDLMHERKENPDADVARPWVKRYKASESATPETQAH